MIVLQMFVYRMASYAKALVLISRLAGLSWPNRNTTTRLRIGPFGHQVLAMTQNRQWNLGTKLALLGAPFLLLVLFSTAATLWISWQLDGGAAAVNEAGRMRMQAYRISLSVSLGLPETALQDQIREFDRSMLLLHTGDPERPLFVPRDDVVRGKYDLVVNDGAAFRNHWLDGRRSGF